MKKLNIPKESKGDKIHSIVKGVIDEIPFVGGVASEIFGIILPQPLTKRREKWMQSVAEVIRDLENSIENFKIENLKNNEEFVTLLIESSQIAIKTHQDEKLNYLQKSISNYFKQDQIEFDKKYSFLRVIDELTPTHMKVLFFISDNQSQIIDKIKGFKDLFKLYLKNESNLDKDYFRKCVRDLEVYSLIRISKDFRDFIGGGGFATDENAPSIKLLDYGKEFIDYIMEK